MKALIISGGEFHKDFCKEFIENLKTPYFDLILCADKGLKYALELGLKVDFAIGDFDSFPIFKETAQYEISNQYEMSSQYEISNKHEKSIEKCNLKNIKWIRLNPEKDSTDTHEAIALAISKGANEIYLLAATGDRLDHSLANILLLKFFEEVSLFLINEKNKVRLLKPDTLYHLPKKEQYGTFVSLIPISSKLEGVNITGCKYNLQNKTVFLGDSLGVSNEITEDIAGFKLKKGYALLIESRD